MTESVLGAAAPIAPIAPAAEARAVPPAHRVPGSHVFWLGVGFAGRMAVYLVLVRVIADSLGPARYGVVSVFLALVFAVAYLGGSWAFVALPVLATRNEDSPRALVPALRGAGYAALAAALVALPIAAL